MAAPTVTFAGASSFSDTTVGETLAGVTWGAGDTIVVLGATEDNTSTFSAVPALAGVTFTNMTGSPTNTASSCKGYAWSAVAASGGSGTLTVASAGGSVKGVAVWVVSAGTSAGVSAPTILVSTAKTVSVTRSGTNSMVVWIGGDWSADTDVTVTASPVGGTQRVAVQNGTRATFFVFDWLSDQGAAGTTSYGIANASGTGGITKIAVEIQGSGGGGGPTVKNLATLGVG